MSYDDVVMRTSLVLVRDRRCAAAVMPVLAFPAHGGPGVGLVNSFKREPSPVLIILYALAEGHVPAGSP
ncbi:Bax inhibitor-1/YccA family protein [Kocuria rhizophila]|nr:Bax inhibitor-1/YccA family protein [Kocuria rhizophila]